MRGPSLQQPSETRMTTARRDERRAAAIELPAEEFERTTALVETLMGRRPELRFDYIQKNARFARDLDV